jgi:hypothetical protein
MSYTKAASAFLSCRRSTAISFLSLLHFLSAQANCEKSALKKGSAKAYTFYNRVVVFQ